MGSPPRVGTDPQPLRIPRSAERHRPPRPEGAALAARVCVVVRQSELAARAAGERAAAAAARQDAASARARELAQWRLRPIHRADAAAGRLEAARQAAESAHRAAIEGCERAAVAHEHAAAAHEWAADIAAARGDQLAARHHLDLVDEARAAAAAARAMALPPANRNAETNQARPASLVSSS